MASFIHNVLRLSLNSTSRVVSDKVITFEYLRGLLEVGTIWMLSPWGIKFDRFLIGNMQAEIIAPVGKRVQNKMMLYLHGGGYALGSTQTHRSMVGQIVKLTRVPALMVDYRKIPEAPCPAAIEDAFAAYCWLLDQGYDGNQIVIAGDSAGGGLALSTIFAIKENKLPMPAGCICLSPWVDLAVKGKDAKASELYDPFIRINAMKRWGRIYAGELPVENPMVSPLYGDFTGFPPMMVQASDGEVLYSDAVRLVEAAKKAGVEVDFQVWNGLIHWWHLFWRIIPEAEISIKKIAEFPFFSSKNP
ncbi:alpha/beta hydrolase [Limibacter armeniacum]|uniref:alpha/beta hydrolase n=1 Tax=Limibacter armeniacum TaxID=466084 RepID=UPI002FE63BD4